ncbi:hypothetical protein [Falsiruegeria mediterranea]|uniref:Uncharacterized protein n=1 Tax=Falsiruegeria mediterranea M17 TaxID=1200281 RepID=A0A2R8CGJ0_9RHOB|nr:hypothetical protein [Falsiruegeria mediterranea]SPJ31517.1 hypothetical protein TRM7615_05060 [Falsiruegeria mediterranea M17]
MKSLAYVLSVAAMIAPLAVFAQSCETVATVTTDGTGAPDRYRTGGTYFPVKIETIGADQTLRIAPLSGPYQYVTLHSRTPGGSWSTSYKGNRTEFPGTDPIIAECRQSSNCTHIIVSVNGGHEKYEPVLSSADVQLCRQVAHPHQDLTLDTTWTAPKSGWQIDLPSQWTRDVQDDPNGGTGMFTSQDGNVVVGVTTMTPDQHLEDSALIEAFHSIMFSSAPIVTKEPVNLAGIQGTLHRYNLLIDGTGYWAIAVYLPAAPNYYIGWGIVPEAMMNDRAEDVVKVLNTLRLLDPPQALETRPDAALSVVLLTVGDDARISQAPGYAKTIFQPSTPEIHMFAAITGTERTGHILQQLHYLENGQLAMEQALDVAAVPTGQMIELRGSFLVPTNGWPLGAYRVVLSYEGKELASHMIYVGEAE